MVWYLKAVTWSNHKTTAIQTAALLWLLCRTQSARGRISPWSTRRWTQTTWRRLRGCWRTSSWTWTRPGSCNTHRQMRLRKSKFILERHRQTNTQTQACVPTDTPKTRYVTYHQGILANKSVAYTFLLLSAVCSPVTEILLCLLFQCEKSAWSLGKGLRQLQGGVQPEARFGPDTEDRLGSPSGWKTGQFKL